MTSTVYIYVHDVLRSFDILRWIERALLLHSLRYSYFSHTSDHVPRINKSLITLRINLRSVPQINRRYFSWQLIRSLPLSLFSFLALRFSKQSIARLRTINSRRGFARKWIAFFARHYANENIARGGSRRCSVQACHARGTRDEQLALTFISIVIL